MNFSKLKGAMREKNFTQELLAEKIGITPQSLNSKLNGRTSFTISEAQKIAEALRLENPQEYFFSHYIPNMQQ